uniref:Uncharacterized protein n=1 Tax=White spot syndrome virus TaxID=342409 RepID=A0A6B9MPJ7_9VIRU|nr:hypothetical protein [White spot syndrome virus]
MNFLVFKETEQVCAQVGSCRPYIQFQDGEVGGENKVAN